MEKKDLVIILCDFKNYVEELKYKYPEKKGIYETVSLQLSLLFFNLDNTTLQDIKDIQDEYDLYLDGFRFCTKCGKFMREGYLTHDSEPYCSLECLEMTQKEIDDQYDDNEDCIFYTNWED